MTKDTYLKHSTISSIYERFVDEAELAEWCDGDVHRLDDVPYYNMRLVEPHLNNADAIVHMRLSEWNSLMPPNQQLPGVEMSITIRRTPVETRLITYCATRPLKISSLDHIPKDKMLTLKDAILRMRTKSKQK